MPRLFEVIEARQDGGGVEVREADRRGLETLGVVEKVEEEDLIEFEVIPVVTSAEAAATVARRL